MLLDCLKCKKIQVAKIQKTQNVRIMLSSKCEVCESENMKIIKEQEATIMDKIYETNSSFHVK